MSKNAVRCFPEVSKFTRFNMSVNLLFIPLIVLSTIFWGSFVVLGFHWENPCKPSLIGSYLLKECQRNDTFTPGDIFTSARTIVEKIIVFALNITMWNFLSSCGAFIVSVCLIIIPITQQEFLQFAENQLVSLNIYESLGMYRKLHLLNSLYNQVQKHILGVIMICAMLGISISLALLVASLSNSEQEANLIAIIAFVVAIMNSTIILLCFLSEMVAVRTKTENYLMKVKKLELRQTGREKRMWIRRYWRSCATVKIKFGENNFLEKLTPLRCLDFSVNLTVQFLLLSRVK